MAIPSAGLPKVSAVFGALAVSSLLFSQGCSSPLNPGMETEAYASSVSRADALSEGLSDLRHRVRPGDSSTNGLVFTFDSPESLARSFLRALSAGNVEKLKRFALTEQEFRDFVWPQLPRSRPEMGLPVEYAWGELNQKSLSSLAVTFRRHGGRKYELVSIGFREETTDYGLFLVHRRSRVVVRDERGRVVELELFGSILETQGTYKLFSYWVD
jgi:hypothetical protein